MRSELKWKSRENAARVFLTWTILQMEMNSDFKKWVGDGEVGFHTPLAAYPRLIIYTLNLKGYMDYHGVGGVGGGGVNSLREGD